MKKNLILFLICICIVSCKRESDYLYNGVYEDFIEITDSKPLTRATVPEFESISNPDLYSNWENVDKIFLNAENGGGVGRYAFAPWSRLYDTESEIPDNISKSVKKENGWQLICHTFYDVKAVSHQYIMFYNKYSGICKFFYYNPDAVLNQNLIWTIMSDENTSLLPSNTHAQHFYNEGVNISTTSNLINREFFNYSPLVKGWNVFTYEFMYGIVNNMPKKLSIGHIHTADIQLNVVGKYAGEVIFKDVKKTTPFGSIDKVITAAASALGKTIDFFNRENEKDSTIIKPEIKSIYYIPATRSLVSVAKGVEKGLKVVGAVLGFGNALFGKTEEVEIRGTSAGNINCTASQLIPSGGTIAPWHIYTDKLNLEKNFSFGVWNLKEKPTLKYNTRITDVMLYEVSDISSKYNFSLELIPEKPLNDLIIFNPSITNDIARYNVSIVGYCSTSPSAYWQGEKLKENWYKISDYGECINGDVEGKPMDVSGDTSHSFHDTGRPIDDHVITYDSVPYAEISSIGDIYAIVSVSITYKNGIEVNSVRVYETNIKPIYNRLESTPDARFIRIN